ncbi:MAG: hypothetical protein FWF75_00340 [Propionibacteriaceae bacterium]|nr:hypothetical protein [Propionibacteriaceae bacterium]
MAHKQTPPDPPFVFGRIAEGDCFADRDAERARLDANFAQLTNTIIVSPRRWGKSSLVERVSQDLIAAASDIHLCQIDLFTVRTEADFYAHLAQAVLEATLTKWDEWVDAVQTFMSHLRPSVSISADPGPDIRLNLDWHTAEQNPDDVLDLAENIAASRGLRLVVCIDEFQAIAGFTDTQAFQRKLRAHWQRHQHVCYCLYGSKRHMLLDIFANPEQPFYRFGDILALDKIANPTWGDFIAGRFAATGKSITPELGRTLAAAVDNHPYYVQQLAQQAWLRTTLVCRPELVDAALADLTDQLGLLFTGLAESLTRRQLGFLQAVLDGQPALSSQATLRAYDLGTSANVGRIRDALVNREIIDVEGGQIQILDPVFAHWLRTAYFTQR